MAMPQALQPPGTPARGLVGRGRAPSVAVALAAALLLALVLTLQMGAVPVALRDWWAPWVEAGDMTGGAHVLWNLRVPRVLLAIFVGASLALAGALAQGLFRNPLVDPGLLGVTAGAAAIVALVLTVFASMHMAVPPHWRVWVLPVSAFTGAIGVCYALDRTARWLTPGSVAGLLLTGLALNAIAMAIVGLCSYLATDEQLRNLTFWTLGSLGGANWTVVAIMGTVLLIAAGRARFLADALNALALGEAAAGHVGIDVQRLRARVVIVVALLSALAVAWCGLIGFIGLMAPHLVRTWAGPDQRRVLPLSMLAGGLLLVVADTAARTVAIPAEIPVGIFTAIIGGPAFLFMLRGVVRASGGGV